LSVVMGVTSITFQRLSLRAATYRFFVSFAEHVLTNQPTRKSSLKVAPTASAEELYKQF